MQVQPRIYTPEEYLALEESAEEKSEYHDGQITPMTGGTIDHNQIVGNFIIALNIALKNQDYRVYFADVRLWIPQEQRFTYPDVMVIAGRPEYYNNRKDTITNPLLIVEVLSELTKTYDREALPERYRIEKFKAYGTIATFQEYVLISQTAKSIEQFAKIGNKKWSFRLYDEEDEAIEFDSIESQVSLADLYDKVDFDGQEA